MISKSNFVSGLFGLIILTITIQSCKKDEPEPAKGIDLQLYEMAQETAGFTWYKNSDALLDKSSGSGHNYPLLRTRYNSTAATQLDSDGKVSANASFPEGSFVVKELTNNDGSIGLYAILYKKSDSEHADDRGWVWGYIYPNGDVATSAVDKGAICTGCHLQSESIDYMLMNKFFP
ncbi:MAG: cytochrome P460 family protein [Flavobacteriales bacterium]|nr:cytochrome P460 family protein [Flavobacteriales bacterium]